MKVLWLCNLIIPQICAVLEIPSSYYGGWLTQLADYFDADENVELAVCANYEKAQGFFKTSWGNNSLFYGYKASEKPPHLYDASIETAFKKVLEDYKPDIVHIFGTEFPHTLSMVRAFNNPSRTVIHIQGLVSVIAKHYEAFLPQKVCRAYSFRDFVRHDNIIQQKRKFIKRGQFEIEAIKNVSFVMGRTEWDHACAKLINPDIHYYKAQELLRENFYNDAWSYDNCNKHTILMSQSDYPIKGLHLALETLSLIKCRYPDVRLFVCGANICKNSTFKDRLKSSYYAQYLNGLIRKYHLESNVIFTGPLSAEEMKTRMLNANVFMSSSTIENSSNSIGEALLLGVPVVASYVGGTVSLAHHGEDAYLYQADAPYMAAEYIMWLFADEGECKRLSENARERARVTYDAESVYDSVKKAYLDIVF